LRSTHWRKHCAANGRCYSFENIVIRFVVTIVNLHTMADRPVITFEEIYLYKCESDRGLAQNIGKVLQKRDGRSD